MSTLLTKPIGEITYVDVTSILNSPDEFAEGYFLEYKSVKDVVDPKDVGKAASAFANTFGGTLILGVDENHETGRPLSVSGIPQVREQENRILNILTSNVFPPLVPTPEVRAIEFPDDPKRAVVVIRIWQSNATPHAAYDKNGNQHFYVRERSQSQPANPRNWEVPASREKLEWLFARRRKSEDLRDSIVKKALDRLKLYYERGNFPSFVGQQRPHGQGLFWVVPLYPEEPLVTVQRLYEQCVGPFTDTTSKLAVRSKVDVHEFPLYSLMDPRTIQDAVLGFTELYDGVRSYEFNVSGLLLYQETFAHRLPEGSDVGWDLDFVILSRQLDCCLQLASRFYSLINPVGLLQLHFGISNLEGLCMLPPRGDGLPSTLFIRPRDLVSHQRSIDCERTVQASLLADEEYRNNILLGLLRDIGSSFNWDWKLVQQCYDLR